MLESCSKRFSVDKGCSQYKTYDQFVAMTFGQLNKCLTLCDISTGIGVSETEVTFLTSKVSSPDQPSYQVSESYVRPPLQYFEWMSSKLDVPDF
ncbi:MAG: hypothetical protein ACI837_000427 [Crocinitomicaceae bacterium]|jgi:hypothetical protein